MHKCGRGQERQRKKKRELWWGALCIAVLPPMLLSHWVIFLGHPISDWESPLTLGFQTQCPSHPAVQHFSASPAARPPQRSPLQPPCQPQGTRTCNGLCSGSRKLTDLHQHSGRPKHSALVWKVPPECLPMASIAKWLLRALSIETRRLAQKGGYVRPNGVMGAPLSQGLLLPEEHTWVSCTLAHRTIPNLRQSKIMDGTVSVCKEDWGGWGMLRAGWKMLSSPATLFPGSCLVWLMPVGLGYRCLPIDATLVSTTGPENRLALPTDTQPCNKVMIFPPG